MGCVESRGEALSSAASADDDTNLNVFYVQNVDEQGTELNEGHLEVNEGELVLHQRSGDPIRWPLKCLRRYGFNEELFSFESGRRCTTGPGIFAFKCRRADVLFNTLQWHIRATSQRQAGSGGQRRLQHSASGQPTATAMVATMQQQQQQQLAAMALAGQPPPRYSEHPQTAVGTMPIVRNPAISSIVEPYLRPLSVRGNGVLVSQQHQVSGSVDSHDGDHMYMNGLTPNASHNYVNTNGTAAAAGTAHAQAVAASAAVVGDGSQSAATDKGPQGPKPGAIREINYALLDLHNACDSSPPLQQRSQYLNMACGIHFIDAYGTNSSSDEDDAFDHSIAPYVNVATSASSTAVAVTSSMTAPNGGEAARAALPALTRPPPIRNYANLDVLMPATSARPPMMGFRKVNYTATEHSSAEKTSIKKVVPEEKLPTPNYTKIDFQKTVALSNSTKVVSPDDHRTVRKTRHDSAADDLQ